MGKLNSDILTSVYETVNKAKAEAYEEFAERACDALRTGNIIMDKSIADVIYNLANEMKEELK